MQFYLRKNTMGQFRVPQFLLLLMLVASIVTRSTQFGLHPIVLSEYPTLDTNLPSGYYVLGPGDQIEINSPNYPMRYPNSESLDWKFSGDGCAVIVECPCSDMPASFQCLGDNLKFSDSVYYSQRFCGDVRPQGIYRSVSGTYRIRFNSDKSRSSGKGFVCYVGCTAPGKADVSSPIPPGDPMQQCFTLPIPPPSGIVSGGNGVGPGGRPSTTTFSPTPGTSSTTGGTSTSTTGGASTSTTGGASTSTAVPTPTSTTTIPPGPVILDPPAVLTDPLKGGYWIRIPIGCNFRPRQIPVGESIRETKPKPNELPPWCT